MLELSGAFRDKDSEHRQTDVFLSSRLCHICTTSTVLTIFMHASFMDVPSSRRSFFTSFASWSFCSLDLLLLVPLHWCPQTLQNFLRDLHSFLAFLTQPSSSYKNTSMRTNHSPTSSTRKIKPGRSCQACHVRKVIDLLRLVVPALDTLAP